MIHRLIVLDRNKSVGVSVFDNGELHLQPDLLIGLVQALMLLGQELGPAKGALREAELGKYQISIYSRDHLAYVAVQDAYDSEPFTSSIILKLVDQWHDKLVDANFNTRIPIKDQISAQAQKILTTMKFPKQLLPAFRDDIAMFDESISYLTDTILLTDLDDGIIEIFKQPKDDHIIKLLMEILSEIPFERHWIGESKLRQQKIIHGIKKDFEAWLIYRIPNTDFCFMGRAYYNHGDDRDKLVTALEDLTTKASQQLADLQE